MDEDVHDVLRSSSLTPSLSPSDSMTEPSSMFTDSGSGEFNLFHSSPTDTFDLVDDFLLENSVPHDMEVSPKKSHVIIPV